MNNRNIIIGAVVAVLVGFALGWVLHTQGNLVSAISTSGVNNNLPTQSSTVFSPTTSNGTSTSILNSGGSDRAITSVVAYCSNIGTSQNFLVGNTAPTLVSNGWTLLVATTSVANQGLQANANYIANTFVATTTSTYFTATSTEGVIAYANRIWPTGSYLTFNSNATNTATCTYGANWLPL